MRVPFLPNPCQYVVMSQNLFWESHVLSPHYKIKPCVSEVNHVPFNAFCFPWKKSYKKDAGIGSSVPEQGETETRSEENSDFKETLQIRMERGRMESFWKAYN